MTHASSEQSFDCLAAQRRELEGLIIFKVACKVCKTPATSCCNVSHRQSIDLRPPLFENMQLPLNMVSVCITLYKVSSVLFNNLTRTCNPTQS